MEVVQPPIVPWSQLWDQTDAVGVHTCKGIEFLDKVGNFCKERAAIEEEYAGKLRSLVKRNNGKKKEDEEVAKVFTCVRSFNLILKELEALAGQHEVMAERMRKELLPFVATKSNAHRLARKQHLHDLSQINANLAAARETMAKQQKAYGKTFKEAEASYLKYSKAEKNMDISRLDLERSKQNATMKNDQSEEAKQNYAHALTAANEAQQRHFDQHLPAVLEKLRTLDDERIRDTRAALEMAINTEKEVSVIVSRCHDDMKTALSIIDPSADTAAVVEQFRTGYAHPPLAQFEDLGQPSDVLNGGGSVDNLDGHGSTLKRGILGNGTKKDGKGVTRKQSMHHKIFGGGDSKKSMSDTNGDYGSLPPQQRARRLQAKLGELEKEREKRIQAKDGVVKMQQVYRDNTKLGNPADCEQQIVSYAKEIDTLTQQMQKYRLLLDDAIAHTAPPMAGSDTPPSSRSESGASSHYSTGNAPPRPLPPSLNGMSPHVNHRTSYSEESVSSEGSRQTNNNERRERDEVYDEMTMPPLGTCTALFDFEGGTTEGTIIMKESQEFLLIERDEGDGWTRVRSLDGKVEGFVPSTYVKCKWYPE